MTQAEHEYVLKTGEAELSRLGLQHRLWCELANGAWERSRFGPGQTILDIGCGPGYAAVDLSQLVGPQGRVIAADVSQRFIAHLDRVIESLDIRNIETHIGDAQALQFEGAGFDGAWARWVLCFVEDPRAVIEGAAAALQPGGRFAVQDYFRYRGITLAPYGEAMERIADAVHRSWTMRGGDPDVMQRGVQMMCEAGFEIESIRPIVRTARPDHPLWRWPETFFANYLNVLFEMDLVTEDDCDAFRRDWQRCAASPGGLFSTPPMLEVIGRKR